MIPSMQPYLALACASEQDVHLPTMPVDSREKQSPPFGLYSQT